MNTEELKMILEAISSLGASGKEAFIWWMVFKYGLSYLTALVLIVAGAIVLRFAVLKITGQSCGNQLGNELTELLQIEKHSSYGWEYESYRPKIKAEIINKVRELMANKKP